MLLAESSSPVLVFETGLPTRYYLPRTDVRFAHLGAQRHPHRVPLQGPDQRLLVDRRRARPTSPGATTSRPRAVLPIAGLVAFLDEAVDVVLDGVAQERPVTHFSR